MPGLSQDIRIEGLSELERNLLDLAEEYGPRNAAQSINRPMIEALTPLRDQIERTTPIDTGRLRESTRIVTGAATRRLRRQQFVGPNAVWIGRVGWLWRSRAGERRFVQALSVEYGTRFVAAQPTIRRAFEKMGVDAAIEFGALMADSIERTANRLYRRQQAGTLRRR